MKGGRVSEESRLSLEGLKGTYLDDKRIKTIVRHGERRRSRTVVFEDGTRKNMSIYDLVGALIEARGRG